jgi:hypothetical protein
MAGGIYSANLEQYAVTRQDSCFRGNDWRLEGDPIPSQGKHTDFLSLDKRNKIG